MVFFTSRGKVKRVYSPIFSENSWNAIIEACHAEEVPSEWVADGTCYKDMEINGTNYRIDIIGKNHDTYGAIYLYTNGSVSNAVCTFTYGYRPCFTLPSTLLFNPDTNEVVA